MQCHGSLTQLVNCLPAHSLNILVWCRFRTVRSMLKLTPAGLVQVYTYMQWYTPPLFGSDYMWTAAVTTPVCTCMQPCKPKLLRSCASAFLHLSFHCATQYCFSKMYRFHNTLHSPCGTIPATLNMGTSLLRRCQHV